MQTPWGLAQDVTELAAGISIVSTASHGGIKLDRKRNALMPSYMRNAGGWYEEDCEWSKVGVVFPEIFKSEEMREHAKSTLREWFPDEYEAFFGVKLNSDESYVLKEREFKRTTHDKFVVSSAFGSWAVGGHYNVLFPPDGVPKGMVGVGAKIASTGETGTFLVPEAEYNARGRFGFIVDPSRHKRLV